MGRLKHLTKFPATAITEYFSTCILPRKPYITENVQDC